MRLLKNIFAAAVFFICTVACINEEQPLQADLTVGDSVPDFTVVMNNGSVVTGDWLRKGVSVIMFFNTGCPDCQKTLPSLQSIYEEYDPEVKFALISREQGDDEIAPYWKSQGYTMPYSAQSDRTIYNMFASSRVPRVYICKDGIIKFMYDDDPVPSHADLKSCLKDI